MKKLLTTLLLACALCAGLFTLPGCTTPATTAYKVTSGTYLTVDAAMVAWGDYVRIYKPAIAQEQQVAQAYKTWQNASLTVIATARAAQTTSDATTQAKVNAAIAAASSALSGLVTVLQQFGINLVPQS